MTDYQHLARMIKDIDFCMLTTEGSDGALYSRPMATLAIDETNFDGSLWFFTRRDTPKVHELEENQRVNLSYSQASHQKYVSVSGRATIVVDRQKFNELWRPAYKAWFPEGLEDAQLALIRVDIESAEIWDSPSSKIVQAIGFMKASITGQPYKNAGENRQMNFRNSPGIH